MPVVYIDLPSGLGNAAKAGLVREVTAALHEAYPIPDTRVYLRDWQAGSVGIDGDLSAPIRPICSYVVPPGLPPEGKRRLVARVSAALGEAGPLPQDTVALPSGKTVRTRWVLSFFNEFPLDRAALDDRMAFENPMVTESMEASMQAPGRALP